MKDGDFGVDTLLYSPHCIIGGAVKDAPVAELDGNREARSNNFCSSQFLHLPYIEAPEPDAILQVGV